MTISGAARVSVLLGDPLHKANSPGYYNTFFAEHGRNAVLVPMEVAPDGFDALVRALKQVRNIDGLIITMPHKQSILAHLDVLGPTASIVGSANVARREADGRWAGDMFDGPGYAGALAARDIEVPGRRAYFTGCGGVARAMAVALAEGGISALRLHDLDASRAHSLAALIRERYPRIACEIGVAEPGDYDLAINATPLGMRPDDPLPFDVSALTARTAVSDVTTQPVITPLIEAAQARGCRVTTGRDMFDTQTALTVRFFGWDR